ncbi:hypothetical protein BOTBODRAFT_450021 [Botryobasidium botryosum FD-172 SS1]|uniref:Uncharacterized protein n=1 Tax=Botryobasidium botryosum (strain FD-172 SS1) TaxID=930990 RepID=A0A067M825_BOTB1|nr:hypothetical protein BOTBODRAFT_450021 [Botryobasidium botryosum FD-172 SS1]
MIVRFPNSPVLVRYLLLLQADCIPPPHPIPHPTPFSPSFPHFFISSFRRRLSISTPIILGRGNRYSDRTSLQALDWVHVCRLVISGCPTKSQCTVAVYGILSSSSKMSFAVDLNGLV